METIAEDNTEVDEVAEVGQEREPLFPDQEEPVFIDTMHLTRGIYAIRHLERQCSQYRKQQEEAASFYTSRRTQCEERIEFIKRSMLAFLD